MKLILHKIYDGYLFFQFKMWIKYQGRVDFDNLYTQIFLISYYNIIWCMILYIYVSKPTIENRVAFGIFVASIFLIIIKILERYLKKINFIEELYEYYKTFSDSERRIKEKKGLYYNVLPICLLPLLNITLCYILSQVYK